MNVVGISFHVGSAATNPAAFEEAIALARAAFDEGLKLGFAMELLDIGGGFSSGCFDLEGAKSIPAAVSRALETHFPSGCGVRIISEPGRSVHSLSLSAVAITQSIPEKGTQKTDLLRIWKPRLLKEQCFLWVPTKWHSSILQILY